MTIFWKIFGLLTIGLAVLGIFPALMSGAVLVLVEGVLVLSGITALSGNIKYALVVLAITTINLSFSFFTSPVPGWGRGDNLEEKVSMLLIFSIPYTIAIALIAIGYQIKQYKLDTPEASSTFNIKPKKLLNMKDPYFIFVVVYFILVFIWLFPRLSKGFSSLMNV